MTSQGHFIRRRGRVRGPFSVQELQKMVRRGTLTSIDELSADGENWSAAGAADWLFPHGLGRRQFDGAPSRAPSPESWPVVGSGYGTVPAQNVPAEDSRQDCYYSREGHVSGPFSSQALFALARRGELGPDDLVWQEQDRTALPARASTLLAGAFADGAQGAPHTGAGGLADPMPLAPDTVYTEDGGGNSVHRLSLAGGIAAALLLLFALNIPVGRDEHGLSWWWGLVNRPGMGMVNLFSFYVLFIGLSLLFLAPMLRGQARGWSYVGMGGLGLPLLIVAGLRMEVPVPQLVLGALFPALTTAVLLAVMSSRARTPDEREEPTREIMAGIATALTAILAAGLGVWGLIASKTHSDRVSGWLVGALVVGLTGFLGALACGIMGIIKGAKGPSNALARATIALAIVVLAAPLLASMMIGYGEAVAAEGGSRFVLVRVLRMMVMGYALISLCGIGLSEALLSAQPPSDP